MMFPVSLDDPVAGEDGPTLLDLMEDSYPGPDVKVQDRA